MFRGVFGKCSGGVRGGVLGVLWGLFWGFSRAVLVAGLGHLGPQVVVPGGHIGDELVGGTYLAGSNRNASAVYAAKSSKLTI